MRLFRPGKGIHTRLLISYFFFLLPLIAFGALWTNHLADGQRDLAITETEEEAEYVSDRLGFAVESTELALKTAGEAQSLREMNGDARPFLAAMLALNPMLVDVSVFNLDGKRIVSTDSSQSQQVSYVDDPLFQQVLRTGSMATGQVHISESGSGKGFPVTAIAIPLTDSSGAVVGVVAADLTLEGMRESAVEKSGDAGSYRFAVDGSGRVLFHPNEEFARSFKSLADIPPVAAVIRGQRGVMDYEDPYDRQGYLAVYQPVPLTAWGVVAVHPLSLIDSARRDSVIAGGLLIAFASALAFLLATLYARPIATSMGQLVVAARAISEGKLGTTVGIKRRDEIGEMANAFNAMSLDLAHMVRRLEEAHQRLEAAYREVGEDLTSSLDLRLTLGVAMRSAAERLSVEAAAVGLLDPSSSRLQWTASLGDAPEATAGSVVDVVETSSFIQQAIKSRTPVASSQPGSAASEASSTEMTIAIPLISHGRCLGVFLLYGSHDRLALADDELNAAQSFANQVAIAVANAQAHAEIERLVEELTLSRRQLATKNEELQAQNEEIQAQSEEIQVQSEELRAQDEELRTTNVELQDRNHELERSQADTEAQLVRLAAIGEVSKAISSSLDLQEVCQQAIESTVRVSGSTVGILRVANRQEGTLELRAMTGVPAEYRNRRPALPIDDTTLAGMTVLRLQPQITRITGAPPDTRVDMARLNVDTMATIPILCREKVVGVLVVGGAHEPHALSEDLDLMMTIANQIGMAIENASLFSQVSEVDRLKDEFMSIASHELRTPLTSIKGYAQLLLRRAGSGGVDDPHLRGLQVINEQIDRMTRLVSDLLDVTRIGAGRFQLRLQPAELGRLARRVVEDVQITTEKHEMYLDLPPADITGSWDTGRVEQVLHNLLTNAVKYSPAGGRIWVKLTTVDREVEVSVRDEGIGIPKGSIPHLFDRFFQARNVDHTNYGGLGLGLYISYQIVQAHSGRMWVESEEDRGSVFHFRLPLA